jgi:hypothetical protein
MAERKRNAPMNYTPGRATTAAASTASPAASGIDAADRASRRACVQRRWRLFGNLKLLKDLLIL